MHMLDGGEQNILPCLSETFQGYDNLLQKAWFAMAIAN